MSNVAVIVGDFGSLWEALPIVAYGTACTFLFVDKRTPKPERDRSLARLLSPGDTFDTFYADSKAIPHTA